MSYRKSANMQLSPLCGQPSCAGCSQMYTGKLVFASLMDYVPLHTVRPRGLLSEPGLLLTVFGSASCRAAGLFPHGRI